MSTETPRTHAVQQTTDKISETDIREQAAHPSAQLMQSQAETLQATMNASSELAARLMEQSADQWRRIFSVWSKEAQKPIHSVSANEQATVPPNPSLNDLARDISREWLDFFRERTAKNLAGFNRLIACRNPQDLAAVQSAITRDNLISFLQCAQRVTTKSMQMANAAAKSAAKVVERSDPS